MEKKDGELQLQISTIYTLDRNREPGAEIGDKTVFLYKNGKMCWCPFLSSVDKSAGMLVYPCGNYCHHFNMIPHKDKEGKLSGRLYVRQTCGSTVDLPIANIKLPINDQNQIAGQKQEQKAVQQNQQQNPESTNP